MEFLTIKAEKKYIFSFMMIDKSIKFCDDKFKIILWKFKWNSILKYQLIIKFALKSSKMYIERIIEKQI